MCEPTRGGVWGSVKADRGRLAIECYKNLIYFSYSIVCNRRRHQALTPAPGSPSRAQPGCQQRRPCSQSQPARWVSAPARRVQGSLRPAGSSGYGVLNEARGSLAHAWRIPERAPAGPRPSEA